MTDDLISRQAAIEIIDGYMNRLANHIGTPTDNERYAYARGTLLGVMAGITALPSTQKDVPERIVGYWQMFDLITSAYCGEMMYSKQDNGIVYSRYSGKYMRMDEAINEFLALIGEERE